MSELGIGTPPFETIQIDGMVQKNDGSNFSEAETVKFLDDFLDWMSSNGLGFGGVVGGVGADATGREDANE